MRALTIGQIESGIAAPRRTRFGRTMVALSAFLSIGLITSAQAARISDGGGKPKSSRSAPDKVVSTKSGSLSGGKNVHPIAQSKLLRNAVYRSGIGSKFSTGKTGKVMYSSRSYGGMSCVPFARSASGIDLKGNAANWWDAAAGVYARGANPEPGSVLNFRSTGHMRLGHVAVVTGVVNSREIEIDHANWWGPGAGRGGVSRGVSVVDVSERNDWSAVRVSLGRAGDYGSVYPTYGFIYDRPDSTGMMVANRNAKPATVSYDEVAEAPAQAQVIDAPGRSLR